jgi:protease prsW family protein
VTDLLALVAPFALSFALVSPFYFVLRAKLLAFIAGATIVAIGALLLESWAQTAAGDLAGPTLVLLLVAPVTEELLKLGISVPTGATYESAAGVGAGFAASENGLYFLVAWGDPLTTLLVLVAVRALTDPLLHITTCTLTTSSWRGQPWALPAGILIHIGWNAMALFVTVLNPLAGLVLLVASGLIVLGVYVHARKSPSLDGALSGRPPSFPWTRAAA